MQQDSGTANIVRKLFKGADYCFIHKIWSIREEFTKVLIKDASEERGGRHEIVRSRAVRFPPNLHPFYSTPNEIPIDLLPDTSNSPSTLASAVKRARGEKDQMGTEVSFLTLDRHEIKEQIAHFVLRDSEILKVHLTSTFQHETLWDSLGWVATQQHAYQYYTLRFSRLSDNFHLVFSGGKAAEGDDLEKEIKALLKKVVQYRSARRVEAQGSQNIVLSEQAAGILAHEICHLLEYDRTLFNLGDFIFPEGLSIADDPTLKGCLGSYHFDSEGIPGKKTSLINKGEIAGFLNSLDHFKGDLNGHGRADPYRKAFPRISNTVIQAGAKDILADVQKGIFIDNVAGAKIRAGLNLVEIEVMTAFPIERGQIMPDKIFCNFLWLLPLDGIEIWKPGQLIKSTGSLCQKKGSWIPVGMRAPQIFLHATKGDFLCLGSKS